MSLIGSNLPRQKPSHRFLWLFIVGSSARLDKQQGRQNLAPQLVTLPSWNIESCCLSLL
jgi:hypothetical protein